MHMCMVYECVCVCDLCMWIGVYVCSVCMCVIYAWVYMLCLHVCMCTVCPCTCMYVCVHACPWAVLAYVWRAEVYIGCPYGPTLLVWPLLFRRKVKFQPLVCSLPSTAVGMFFFCLNFVGLSIAQWQSKFTILLWRETSAMKRRKKSMLMSLLAVGVGPVGSVAPIGSVKPMVSVESWWTFMESVGPVGNMPMWSVHIVSPGLVLNSICQKNKIFPLEK